MCDDSVPNVTCFTCSKVIQPLIQLTLICAQQMRETREHKKTMDAAIQQSTRTEQTQRRRTNDRVLQVAKEYATDLLTPGQPMGSIEMSALGEAMDELKITMQCCRVQIMSAIDGTTNDKPFLM